MIEIRRASDIELAFIDVLAKEGITKDFKINESMISAALIRKEYATRRICNYIEDSENPKRVGKTRRNRLYKRWMKVLDANSSSLRISRSREEEQRNHVSAIRVIKVKGKEASSVSGWMIRQFMPIPYMDVDKGVFSFGVYRFSNEGGIGWLPY